jgi:hypothetical protein
MKRKAGGKRHTKKAKSETSEIAEGVSALR